MDVKFGDQVKKFCQNETHPWTKEGIKEKKNFQTKVRRNLMTLVENDRVEDVKKK